MEKKKKKLNKACPEVIMYCYTSCGYAKWLQKHSLWTIQNGEKIKGCWDYSSLFGTFLVALMKCTMKVKKAHTHIQTSLYRAEDQQADSQFTDSNIPVCQCSSVWTDTARKTSLVHHVITYCRLLAEIHWNETNENNTQTVWFNSRVGNLLTKLNLSLNIHVIHLYWQSQNTHDWNKNHKAHLIQAVYSQGCIQWIEY